MEETKEAPEAGGLSLLRSLKIVDEAVQKGRETGCEPLAVAVLDSGGHLKAFAREDGAGILRPEIAIGKAWGALGMGVGSRALAKRAQLGGGHLAFLNALSSMSGGRVVPAPGGVLVRDDKGRIIGAVGVTGDVSEKDEACAMAGIESVGLTADPGEG